MYLNFYRYKNGDIFMITMLIFSFNKTEKSFAHNKNDFSELLYEYRNSSFEAYDGENNVTDKFREILKLDDETVIRKIQKEFKFLKIRRIYIEPKLMYSYVPPTINKTLDEKLFIIMQLTMI